MLLLPAAVESLCRHDFSNTSLHAVAVIHIVLAPSSKLRGQSYDRLRHPSEMHPEDRFDSDWGQETRGEERVAEEMLNGELLMLWPFKRK